ncbi:Glutathione import ATP-binding protein GsiA [Geodia barretti]|uniref:Glutathione import ATP-binding protein GsiA n=1 Tax=Geodia barretti TaxID=519541 RepID=A0AA35WQJ4_GEOBA|nr:Glutathione import ATP-binding protein GsiA [Geodia barretti]
MLADSGTASIDGRLDGNGEALVAVAGLTKRFPVTKNLFRQPSSFIHAVDDVSFRLAPGKSLGLVGESGCGKTTVGKLLVKLLEPTSGEIRFRFPAGDAHGGSGQPVDAAAPAGADDLPGPVRVDESPAYHIRHHRRAAGGAGDRQPDGPGGPRDGNPDPGGPDASIVIPVPAPPRAFGRAASTRSHRPRPGHRPVLRGGRRADVHAGRFQPNGHHVADAGTSGATGHRLPVHHPRPGGGPLHVPPHRSHVPGQDHRAGGNRGAAAQPAASVHQGAALGRARARSHIPARSPRHTGRLDPADRSAGEMPLLRPLSDRHRLLPGQPASSDGRTGRGPLGRVLRGVIAGPDGTLGVFTFGYEAGAAQVSHAVSM